MFEGMPEMADLKDEARELFRKREGQFWNPVSVAICIVVPMMLFAHVSHQLATSLRFHRPELAYLYGPGLALLVCGAVSGKVYTAYRRGFGGLFDRRWSALCLCLWFALLSACIVGDARFRYYTFSYYSYQDLASYTNIDPSRDKGQSYMDAGTVYFKESAVVMTSKAVAFQNAGIYCVAPIVRQPIDNQGVQVDPSKGGTGSSVSLPASGTIDFWAVGQDCCDPTGQNFKCGAVDKPLARSGMRLIRDDIRPFYLMAVQEWNAWLNLPSAHPLFFHWVEDPILEVDQYLEKANRMYIMHLSSFLLVESCFVFMILWVLLQIGLR